MTDKPELLNPTLSVVAHFSVQEGDDARRTKLPLKDYPDVAAWLLTFLDFILFKQGRITGKKGIAEPPGGGTRQRLIDGHIILAEQRPDGALALRLHPNVDLRLELNARRHGLPASDTQITLAEDPELTRWVLTHYVNGAARIDPAQLDDTLRDTLRRHSVLVDELPAEEAWYPDPAVEVDLATHFAPMARVFTQAAGQAIPAEVRQVLGRHTPRLPPGTDIAWGQDAGTGMVYPAPVGARDRAQDVGRVAGAQAAQRAAAWASQVEEARRSFRERRFAVLREIVPPAQRAVLRRYVRQLKARGYFPELGDGQVALRASLHNEPTIASLHQGLANIVNTIGTEPVIPSYCMLSCYEAGSVLERHLDRPQCAYNVCVVYDMRYLDRDDEPEPWPIYLELDGKPVAALMRVGDGVFFSGNSIWHWRDALPENQRVVVCFSHFVLPDFTGSLD